MKAARTLLAVIFANALADSNALYGKDGASLGCAVIKPENLTDADYFHCRSGFDKDTYFNMTAIFTEVLGITDTNEYIWQYQVNPAPVFTTIAPSTSMRPSVAPTVDKTVAATVAPTFTPTLAPTLEPTIEPTDQPASVPTHPPTLLPTQNEGERRRKSRRATARRRLGPSCPNNCFRDYPHEECTEVYGCKDPGRRRLRRLGSQQSIEGFPSQRDLSDHTLTYDFVKGWLEAYAAQHLANGMKAVDEELCGGIKYECSATLCDEGLPTISHITLVNAETNQDIMVIDNGGTINLARTGKKLNARADVIGMTSGVDFSMGDYENTERVAPYSIGTDGRGNYRVFQPLQQVGPHTISAIPFYLLNDDDAVYGIPIHLSFVVVNEQVDIPGVEEVSVLDVLSLVDCPLSDGDGVHMGAYTGLDPGFLSFRAITSGPVSSVIFEVVDVDYYFIDFTPPFMAADDLAGSGYALPFPLPEGFHTLIVTPIDEDGLAGKSQLIEFTTETYI